MMLNYRKVCEIVTLYDYYNGDITKVKEQFKHENAKNINITTILTIINRVNNALRIIDKNIDPATRLRLAIESIFVDSEIEIPA